MSRAAAGIALALALGGCTDERILSIDVTSGLESDTFSSDPSVTRVFVDTYAPEGLLSVAETAPGGTFAVGELDSAILARFEVRGLSSDGTLQVRGRSLSVLLGAIEGDTFPVFAQRVEHWSRPPGALDHGHRDGTATALGERYLILTGGEGLRGSASQIAFYDLLTLRGLSGGILSFIPVQVLASANGRSLLALAPDRATWIDFDTSDSFSPALPAGLESWAEVVGGQIVTGPEATYVVGATRDDGVASDKVLVVEANGSLRAGVLAHPREGAAAAWVEDVGLVVAGGSPTAPGVEVVPYEPGDVTLAGEPLPFAPDATRGATAVGTGPEALILTCGTAAAGEPAPVRELDLRGCDADCGPAATRAALDGPREACQAFVRPGGLLVVGNDVGGWLAATTLEDDDVRIPLPLREPRRGASVTVAPNGTLAVLGGVGEDGAPRLSVELLFPRE